MKCYRENCSCEDFTKGTCLDRLTEKQAKLIKEIRRENAFIKCRYISNKVRREAKLNMVTGELIVEGQAIKWARC